MSGGESPPLLSLCINISIFYWGPRRFRANIDLCVTYEIQKNINNIQGEFSDLEKKFTCCVKASEIMKNGLWKLSHSI